MFGKDKVKGHNRLVKSKSGFKVTRVSDFLRKRDDKDNTKRNIAIGTAAVISAGGIALLLRKKRINIGDTKNLLKRSTKATSKYPKDVLVEPKNVVEDIRPSINNSASGNNKFSKADLEKYKKPIVEPRPKVNIQPKKTSNSTSAPSSSSSSSIPPKTDVITPTKKDFDPLPDPWQTPIPSKYQGRGSKLLVKKEINQNRIRAKEAVTSDPWSTPIKSSVKESTEKVVQETSSIKALAPAKFKPESISDPWETAITTKANNSLSMVVTPKSKEVPLLTGKKIPASRGSLVITDTKTAKKVAKKAASDAVRIENMEKTYKSISPDNLAMRATVKINHYLKRPRKTFSLGRPPKETSLAEILDTSSTKNLSNKAKSKAEEKIIKKAQEKVTDRLSRAERKVLEKKARLAKKN